MTRNAVFHNAGAFDDGSPITTFPSAIASVFGRTGTVVAAAGDYFGVVPAALTGATQAARFVGATTSGAPASGTFAVGDVVVARDGHVFVCTTAGSPGTWTDVGGGASVSYATPAILLDSSAAAGAASSVIRSDATIAAFDATAPSTQAFGDSAAVGTAAFAARRDHKHAMPATPTTVSGNAGTATALQTARAIDGQNFDGTAGITVIAPGTHAATTKATPVDADELPLVDSAASNVLKKLTWANVKATLKTYFDTLYTAIGASAPPNGSAGGDLTGSYPNPTLGSGSFATPAIVLGSAAAAGSTLDAIRSDSTIAAFDTTVPSTQAFGDAAAIGTAAFAARRDHVHAMPSLGTIGGVAWTTVGKSVDTSRASAASFVVDPHLTFTAANGSVYEIEIWLVYASPAGAATPDFQYAFGEDATTRGLVTCLRFSTTDAGGSTVIGCQNNAGANAGTAAAKRAVLVQGYYVGAGGTFGVYWGQVTSGVNATILYVGSVIRYRAIG